MSVVENVLTAAIREVPGATNKNCKNGHVMGEELGRGEQGIAYKMVRDKTGANVSKTHVMKVSLLPTATAKGAWEDEARLSKVLGMAGIGPEIYDFWYCRTKGYILMQRMLTDLRHYGGVGETDYNEYGQQVGYKDHLNRVPIKILRDYVNKLEILIGANYLHFDNHPGNLGIVESEDGSEEGILFDFGFTREVDGMTPADKYNALAFSLGQIIEHMPRAEQDTNYIFKLIVSIDKGTYEFGSLKPTATAADIAAFRAFYKIPDADLGKEAALKISAPADVNRSLYVGAKLYNYFLNMPDDMKYDWKSYGTIYEIRQNKAIARAGAGATLAQAAYGGSGAGAGAASGRTRRRGGARRRVTRRHRR